MNILCSWLLYSTSFQWEYLRWMRIVFTRCWQSRKRYKNICIFPNRIIRDLLLYLMEQQHCYSISAFFHLQWNPNHLFHSQFVCNFEENTIFAMHHPVSIEITMLSFCIKHSSRVINKYFNRLVFLKIESAFVNYSNCYTYYVLLHIYLQVCVCNLCSVYFVTWKTLPTVKLQIYSINTLIFCFLSGRMRARNVIETMPSFL